MRKLLTCLGLSIFSMVQWFNADAQNLTQTIRGTVLDKVTRQPLAGVTLMVLKSDPLLGAVSDEQGHWNISGVPVGRQQILASFVGYQTFTTEAFIVSSTKSPEINVEMEEGVVLENVEVVARGHANVALNPLATVSARSFSVEETERIAAGVNDMGRMALSFPGVQQGGDDTENDIIIRGNSSMGMLWRLEGLDIPNPNHFARPGTSGGGITVFSAQLLSRSDFFTGGMPAEYGNALSGAFDIHFKKGNMSDREHRVKIGLLGLDFATEGPLKKERSSYVINYRYSTLGLLNKLGFHLVGERVSNDFQDLSFNLAFNSKDQRKKWTLFSLNGLSLEHYTPVEPPVSREPGIADHWEDREQGSNLGVLGGTFTYLINNRTYLRGAMALMASDIFRRYDTLSLSNDRYRYNTQQYLDQRISTSWFLVSEPNSNWTHKAGIIGHLINFNFFKETAPRFTIGDITQDLRVVNVNGKGGTIQTQAYAQTVFKPSTTWQIQGGLHALWLGLNGTASLDPRFSVQHILSPRQTLALAIGRHHQILPLSAYYVELADTLPNGSITRTQINQDLPQLYSDHIILSHQVNFPGQLRLVTELYGQSLGNVPVYPDGSEDYWMLNDQSGFPERKVVAAGKGRNYGIDMALEKSFANQMYFLLTGSLFSSTYHTGGGVYHPSRFGSKWTSSLTLGRELSWRKGRAFQFGGRLLYNGGFRYTPFDPVLSAQRGTYVPLANAWWEGQVDPYWRIDARLAYRYNAPKLSGSISLDIQNLTSRKNISSVGYDAASNSLNFRRYPGGDFIPVLAFQFDF